MGFLKNFSEPFAFALALWPFVSMLLTVPVLALLYHRDNRIRLSSAIVAYGTVLYLLGLLCFTLYPMPADAAAYCAAHHLTPQINPLQFIGDIRTDGLTAVLQIAFNIVFFLPLGFIMGRIWRWPLPVTAVLSFATSLFLETMQLTGLMGVFPCAYRLFDVDDLLWNTTGALIGFALAMLSLRLIPARVADMTPTTTPGFMRRLITFIIDMTLIGFAVMPTHLFVMIVRSNLPSGSNGSWQSMEPFDWTGSILFLAALILFEGVVPWLRGGCTLGGSFTHMTIETRPREGWLRVAFYVARMATLIAVVWWHSGGFNLLVFIGLGIFWLVKRQMPYDLIKPALRCLALQENLRPLVGIRNAAQRAGQRYGQSRYGTDHGYGHHRRETEIWLLQQPADHRRACCAQYADRGFKYGRSPPLHVVGCLAVEKAQQASVQRGERQAGQNLADQNGRVAVQE